MLKRKRIVEEDEDDDDDDEDAKSDSENDSNDDDSDDEKDNESDDEPPKMSARVVPNKKVAAKDKVAAKKAATKPKVVKKVKAMKIVKVVKKRKGNISSDDDSNDEEDSDKDDDDSDRDEDENDEEEEDDGEPSQKSSRSTVKKVVPKKKAKVEEKKKNDTKKNKRPTESSSLSSSSDKLPKAKRMRKVERLEEARKSFKWWEAPELPDGLNWRKLEHAGISFAPPYIRHGVPMKYDGNVLLLTEKQEEVASFYAALPDDGPQLGIPKTRVVFQKNFFVDFKETFPPGSIVKKFDKCDFSAIKDYLSLQKSLRKAATDEEKLVKKLDKEVIVLQYGYCLIDGRMERVRYLTCTYHILDCLFPLLPPLLLFVCLDEGLSE